VLPEAALAQRRIDYLRLRGQSLPITEVSYIDGQGSSSNACLAWAWRLFGSQSDFSRDPKFVEAKARGVYLRSGHLPEGSEPYMTIANRPAAQGRRGHRGRTSI